MFVIQSADDPGTNVHKPIPPIAVINTYSNPSILLYISFVICYDPNYTACQRSGGDPADYLTVGWGSPASQSRR